MKQRVQAIVAALFAYGASLAVSPQNTLVIQTSGSFLTTDPHQAFDVNIVGNFSNVYDTLVTFEGNTQSTVHNSFSRSYTQEFEHTEPLMPQPEFQTTPSGPARMTTTVPRQPESPPAHPNQT